MRMKESYVEGVAAHNGPESCGVAREGGVEALTGETAGWVLSREMLTLRGADAVEKSGRQHGGTVMARCTLAPRGPRPHARRDTIHTETGRSLDCLARGAPGRSGKATAVIR
jgi:hypothetical protein